MREYVNKDSLNNIVDFLHALLGFCMEPITDSKYVVCVCVCDGPDADTQKMNSLIAKKNWIKCSF